MAEYQDARSTDSGAIVSGSSVNRDLITLGWATLVAGANDLTVDFREDVSGNPIKFSLSAKAGNSFTQRDIGILFRENIHVTFSVTGGSLAVGWR